MGYYVTLEESTFVIPEENLEEATRRMKALNHKPGVVKNGGSYSGGRQTAKWFSWMDEHYDQKLHTAREIFEALGFYTENDEDGSLWLTGYDSKMGQEGLFIEEVKDLAVPGWHMVWRGEDGEVWRQTIHGTKTGRYTFEDDTPEVEPQVIVLHEVKPEPVPQKELSQ